MIRHLCRGWRSIAIAAAAGLAGCQAKVLAPTSADQLRRDNAALSAKVDSLERQLSEARTAMAAATSQSGTGSGVPGPDGAAAAVRTLSSEEMQATPHLAGVSIGGSSHTDRPLRGDGCVARIYLMPVDGLGRFIQVVGSATVTLYWSPPGCEAEVLSCHEVGPLALRDAYRSGFGGTHYTLEWSIDAGRPSSADGTGSRPAWACGSPVEVKVEFTDARSGRVFTARRALMAMATAKGDPQ